VTFTIERNGTVRDLSLSERSGVATLDNSAVLAVRSAKLPPLPREYSGSSVEVRFYFEYAR
jgi:TonB family protein